MTQAQTTERSSPYLIEDQPTSNGRIFLPRAFEHWCALHFGHSDEEIAAAFAGRGPQATTKQVRMAARLIGEVLARGVVGAWARPIGGGEPAAIRASAWELDSFDHRFATGALDPKRPFDAEAEPTSWIFVDMDGWNALVEASLAEFVRPSRTRTLRLGPGAPVEEPGQTPGQSSPQQEPPDERFLRLPEVKRRTGMSRSTVYRRMDEGTFPQTVPMSGNIAAWRESDVTAWLADPR